jgi:type I restriction enzyme S subunit
LLEGLEITEIFNSDLERTQRIDSDFYSKKNLEILSQIDKKYPKPLTEFVRVSDGNHMSISEYFSDEGIPYYRGGDIYNFFIEQTSQPLRIPETVSDWPHMKRSHLQKGDVLLSIVGAIIGNLSLVKTDQKATCSCKLAILRPKSAKPELISTFLKSYFGQNQIQKFRRGSGQTGLILEDFDQLLMPSFSEMFSKKIEAIVNIAFLKSQDSEQTYSAAEILLLETIGLKNFNPSTDPANIKGFKESFLTSGRLDAEYYQKKYEDFLRLIFSYQHGFEELQVLCNLKDSNFTPDDKTEYKYIELADIGKTGEIKGCTTAFGIELPSRARRKVNTNDVVISSIEGSLKSCALVNEEYNNALCSTGFYVINSEKINSETLLVLFKSEPIQNILKQSCSGTILTAINKNEFQKIPVPLIDKSIQELIKGKISESFNLKKQSEQLLETAKRAVEIAIEQVEEEAIKYINLNLK